MDENTYRVHWKSKHTGKLGKSEEPMTHDMAIQWAKKAQANPELISINHWVECDTNPGVLVWGNRSTSH